MPVLAEFCATAEVRNCIDSAVFHPKIGAAVECGSQADIEPTISSEQRGVLAGFLKSLLVHHKHRHASSVLRVEPDLLYFKLSWIDGGRIHFGPHTGLSRLQIVTVDRW